MMTLSQFSDIFALLAVQLRQTDADEATIRGYYTALREVEPEFVAMAAHRLAKEAEWFPKTSEWQEMARQVEAERYEQQRAILRKLSTPLCRACDDTGWARVEETNRVERCGCVELRRLEVLGRRPFPTLPASSHA